jgi:hypothetical protein
VESRPPTETETCEARRASRERGLRRPSVLLSPCCPLTSTKLLIGFNQGNLQDRCSSVCPVTEREKLFRLRSGNRNRTEKSGLEVLT